MNEMRTSMTSTEAVNAWMNEKRQAFESRPDEKPI
jgi:hypothetical protein